MRTKEKSNYLKFVSKSLANQKEGKKRNFISKNPLFFLICNRFAGKSMFKNFSLSTSSLIKKRVHFSLTILVVLSLEKGHKKRLTDDESAYFIRHLCEYNNIDAKRLKCKGEQYNFDTLLCKFEPTMGFEHYFVMSFLLSSSLSFSTILSIDFFISSSVIRPLAQTLINIVFANSHFNKNCS